MNLILESLGQMPYARVFSLVENIQKQAAEELGESPASADESGAHELDPENTIVSVR